MAIEVRDPIHGTISLSTGETAVVDSTEFQRLRAIKQLGFADISFPGATHTRFIHSLGVCHLAGEVFDHVFRVFPFSYSSVRTRFRQVFRLAALLHDVGHGPLSHTTEEVMPPRKDLKIALYQDRSQDPSIRATHEDYTIKYITDSPLADVIRDNFSDVLPIHIACLIDKTLPAPDDFFLDKGMDFRPILSQLVSGELDCDRMDYLERDSYYTGTNYGKFDRDWMISNLTPYQVEGKFYLGLNRRALYTFDDFLISRHHIHLMVYFHHKCIVYEEMLNRYLTSKDCTFQLPASIAEYTNYNDFKLYEHLAASPNEWAQRIAFKKPYKMFAEFHTTAENTRPEKLHQALVEQGIDVIWASSKARLSKYHSSAAEDRAYPIYVIDQYDKWDKPTPIDQTTEIFQKYEAARIIDRLYVAPENYEKAQQIMAKR
nr:HD domain protein [uncultured bacterium]AIA12193.1 HD domain protein [uncultured bacterium]